MKQKKIQNGRLKKTEFFKIANSQMFLWKFDAKGIDVAQPIWLRDCSLKAQKQAKNAFFVFLGCFRAYVGQPHNHIGWATPMSFTSINPTNPSTNPWNFHIKFLRIGDLKKLSFFESAILIYFFKKQTIFFAPWKSVTNYVIEWMGLNF
jgi:hypothetical protein